MVPGYLPPISPVDPLSRVSPSRYLNLAECELREVWAANKAEFLLPVHPAARVGTVIHRMLEKAGKGEFNLRNSPDVESTWNQSVAEVEVEMENSWLERSLLPLSKSVKNFEVQRLRAIQKAREIASGSGSFKPSSHVAERSGTGCEIWVETPDKKIGGFIDHVFASDGRLVIQDYKTGLVLEQGATKNPTDPKMAYVTQLSMYAALYFCTFGRWADELQLVSTQGPPITIPVDRDESMRLVEDAKRKLEEINQVVLDADPLPARIHGVLARPSPSACRNCLFRPNCEPSWTARASSGSQDWPNDIRGELKARQTLANGYISLAVQDGNNSQLIRGISPGSRHPGLLASKTGDRIGCFNLSREPRNNQYQETSFTTIYRL